MVGAMLGVSMVMVSSRNAIMMMITTMAAIRGDDDLRYAVLRHL
jgi:hypothetical protein